MLTLKNLNKFISYRSVPVLVYRFASCALNLYDAVIVMFYKGCISLFKENLYFLIIP